jgi:hypothetical protein
VVEAARELVGQPVRVIWADWRRGRRLGGNLTLTAISRDSSTMFLRGRNMVFQLETQWIVAVEPVGAEVL